MKSPKSPARRTEEELKAKEDEYVRASIKVRMSMMATGANMFAEALQAEATVRPSSGSAARSERSSSESEDGGAGLSSIRSVHQSVSQDAAALDDEMAFLAIQEQRRVEEQLRIEFRQKHASSEDRKYRKRMSIQAQVMMNKNRGGTVMRDFQAEEGLFF